MSSPERLSNRQAVTSVVLVFSLIAMVWYASLLFNPGKIGNPVAYALLVIAELIAMTQLAGTWITILLGSAYSVPADVVAAKSVLLKRPSVAGRVAVLVPISGEPLGVIEPTLIAARDIRLPHRTYLLDDGRSDNARALAQRLGIGYLRREGRDGWKAGNINNALRSIPCDFFAIFDSDHVAHPDFLVETLPWLLVDPRVAYVQTPQHLVNRDGFISEGIAESQEVFYGHVQDAKNRFNAAFCVGTNVLFRTTAVQEIGGMYDKSRSEDIWTSLLLHERGWKSRYVPLVLAHGQAPETVDGFLRQQFRWASGGYEILFKRNPLFRRSLTLDQKLQYLHTALFYTSGFSVLIFYILPLLQAYFGWRPMNVRSGFGNWLLHFGPYFATMMLSTAHLLGRWPRWRTYVIALSAFSAHVYASVAALTNLRLEWNASGVVRSNIDRIKPVMLHLLLLLLSVGAIPVVIANERSGSMALLLSMWLVWNSMSLFAVCKAAFPGAAERKREAAAAPGYGYAVPA